jgi:hypothetical protein
MRILAVGEVTVNTLSEFEVAIRKLDPSRGLTFVVQTADGRIAQRQLGGPASKTVP